MHPVAVEINGQGILRHVCIVQAIALNALLASPLTEQLQILLQPVGEHLPALTEARQFRYGFLFALAFSGGRSLTSDELIQLDLDQQQLARQSPVPESVLLVATDAHALAQIRG